jgi:hypothetical protein
MKFKIVLTSLLLGCLSIAHAANGDCVEKYQNRINQAETWGRLNYKWPAQIQNRKEGAQGMINLIHQARESIAARFPGGEELVRLTYRVNRFRKDENRVTVRQVAEVVVEAERNEIMCPDFSRLMDMDSMHKFVQDTI